MTDNYYKLLVYAERRSVPEEARLILEWLRCEHDQDAEVFAKVGNHGSKFTYCHWVVVKRKNTVAAQVQGWSYFGTVGQAAACADDVLASLFDGHVGEAYNWHLHQRFVVFEDGDEIDYVASAPVELWETVYKCRQEISQFMGDDWVLLESKLGGCYVDHAHVQILPYQARQGGALSAA